MMNKRIFATLVAMGMVASMGTMAVSATAPADPNSGSASGEGNVEAIIDMEVVTATLPTSDATDTELDFTMDPQELIEKSGGGSLSASSLTASNNNTLLFANTGGGYSNKSDDLVITAYNSVKADITVAATYGTASELKFSSTNDFGATINTTTGTDDEKAAAVKQKAADEAAHIYLAMTTDLDEESTASSSDAKTTAFTADGVKLTETAKALDPGQFKVTYTAGTPAGTPGTYSYAYDNSSTNTSKKDNKLTFSFTGSTNPNADWTGLEDETLDIDFVWSVKKHVDSLFTQTSISSTDAVVEFVGGALPEGVTVTAVTGKFDGGDLDMLGSYARLVATGIEIDTAICTYHAGKTIEVTFSNGKTEVINVNS